MRRGFRRCAGCEQNRADRFFVGKRGRKCSDCRKKRVRSSSRAKRLLELYGLLSTEYDALMQAQGNACAVCLGTRRQNLSVDHDHNPATPYVRGLLCRLCNGRLLTAAKDNPEILRRAADYLENPPAYAVIGRRAVRGAHVRNAASVGPVSPQLEAQCDTSPSSRGSVDSTLDSIERG